MSSPSDGGVRVRFSPAPTGYLHVGSARSALFNWLYARHTGGTFVLRIEDTDADRSKPELVDAIKDSLTWLGLDWDEEIHQSDRFELYRTFANDLLEQGKAYRCDCTQEAVKERNDARADGSSGYDSFCRDRNVQPDDGVVVRFRTPTDGVTGWDDLIRGRVEFENAVLEDFVIVRSSGVPLFHVANAYDDWDNAITHVVRGEDLVNTTPRVLLLRQALIESRGGPADPPVYAHLPLIVNEQRKKLSKRRDDVSVGDYKDKGYLPDAMRNYLLTLGWGPKDDIEIRPIGEFVEQFELADINNSPAFFDIKKLNHFNGEYIRAMSPDEFMASAASHIPQEMPVEVFEKFAPQVQQRLVTFNDVDSVVGWIFGEPPEPAEKAWKKGMGLNKAPEDNLVPQVLDNVIAGMETVEWTADALSALVFGVGEQLGTKTQVPVRVAVTGSLGGLPLFEPMAEMDRDVVLGRLRAARAKLG